MVRSGRAKRMEKHHARNTRYGGAEPGVAHGYLHHPGVLPAGELLGRGNACRKHERIAAAGVDRRGRRPKKPSSSSSARDDYARTGHAGCDNVADSSWRQKGNDIPALREALQSQNDQRAATRGARTILPDGKSRSWATRRSRTGC